MRAALPSISCVTGVLCSRTLLRSVSSALRTTSESTFCIRAIRGTISRCTSGRQRLEDARRELRLQVGEDQGGHGHGFLPHQGDGLVDVDVLEEGERRRRHVLPHLGKDLLRLLRADGGGEHLLGFLDPSQGDEALRFLDVAELFEDLGGLPFLDSLGAGDLPSDALDLLGGHVLEHARCLVLAEKHEELGGLAVSGVPAGFLDEAPDGGIQARSSLPPAAFWTCAFPRRLPLAVS